MYILLEKFNRSIKPYKYGEHPVHKYFDMKLSKKRQNYRPALQQTEELTMTIVIPGIKPVRLSLKMCTVHMHRMHLLLELASWPKEIITSIGSFPLWSYIDSVHTC
jgi:hypothetical protein